MHARSTNALQKQSIRSWQEASSALNPRTKIVQTFYSNNCHHTTYLYVSLHMQPWSIDFLTVFKWQHAHLAYVLPAHTACVSLDRHIEKQRVAKSSFISTLFGSFPSLCLATKRTTAPRIPLLVSIAASDRCTSLARALWKKSWYLSPEQRSLWLQGTGKRSNSN